ncbi:MAG: methyltransferase domain-containing protein [Paracoccaceae bacterium]
MQTPPDLTDRDALARFRARVARMANPALFLHQEVALEIQERLNQVNRRFTASAVVTGFPQVWQGFEAARIVPDDDVLDLREGTHDLVIHALGLHWANDPVGQMVQARRALKPDGLFMAVLFGGRTLAELRAALAEAEVAVTGGLSPRVAPMAEIRDAGALLQRAGFALPVADSVTQVVTYASALHLMRDLRAMGEVNALAARNRQPLRRGVLAEAMRLYEREFGEGGRVRATFEMVFLTGWAPAADQPQPLRPGSATARLADALGTKETPAGDPAGPDRV